MKIDFLRKQNKAATQQGELMLEFALDFFIDGETSGLGLMQQQ